MDTAEKGWYLELATHPTPSYALKRVGLGWVVSSKFGRYWEAEELPPVLQEVVAVLNVCHHHPVYGYQAHVGEYIYTYWLWAGFVDGLLDRGEI